MKKIKIYTDGACKGNPGPGGWGAVLILENKIQELYGGEKHTTNNRMELKAAIEALNYIQEPCYAEINTDSIYLKKGITEWIPNWIKNNWKSSSNKQIKNVDLWELLSTIEKKHNVSWLWVKAHNGNSFNERADHLANKGILEYKDICL